MLLIVFNLYEYDGNEALDIFMTTCRRAADSLPVIVFFQNQ